MVKKQQGIASPFSPIGRVAVSFLPPVPETSEYQVAYPSSYYPTGQLKLVMEKIYSQEGLAKVRFDSVYLMMDVVIVGIVGKDKLARIPPKLISAVVIDGLDRAD